jgi:ribosomal protein S18 acetylase RimI-like enzyme
MVDYRQADATQKAEKAAIGKVLYAAIGMVDENDAMFCAENWGHCSGAILAEENSQIIGVITFAVNGRYGQRYSDISVVYTKPEHRDQGIAKKLFVEAIKCVMSEAPDRLIVVDVLCDHVRKILMGLPPELAQQIRYV